MDNFIEFVLIKVLLPITLLMMVGFLLLLFVGGGYELYDAVAHKHHYYSLETTEWKCSAEEHHTDTSYVFVGKAVMPVISESHTCLQYNRVSK